MSEYFVDTCIIIGYATYIRPIADIEKYGQHCERFFNDNYEKICSKNVKSETERVKSKRLRLYEEVCKYLAGGLDMDQIKMKINDDKLRDHLESILKSLKMVPLITEHDRIRLITNLRTIGRIFDQRIKSALSKMKEIVDVDKIHPRYEKVNWEQLLGSRIGNFDDGKILVDCIVLSHYRGHLIFVTTDVEDILNNKDIIFEFVENYCSISIKPNFDICHIAEILNV